MWDETDLMLAQMVNIGAAEGVLYANRHNSGQMKRYLEVYEMRASVIADDDVAAFVHVDIDDVAAVDGAEKLVQLFEEAVRDAGLLVECPAGDVFVEETGGVVPAKDFRYAANALQAAQNGQFVAGQQASKPFQGQPEEGGAAACLEDDAQGKLAVATVSKGIEGGRGKKIVLEYRR